MESRIGRPRSTLPEPGTARIGGGRGRAVLRTFILPEQGPISSETARAVFCHDAGRDWFVRTVPRLHGCDGHDCGRGLRAPLVAEVRCAPPAALLDLGVNCCRSLTMRGACSTF